MKKLILLVSFAIFIISCKDSSNDSYNVGLSTSSVNSFTSSRGITKKSEVYEADISTKNKDEIVSRKLIKNGNIRFETDNLEQTKNTIAQLVKKYQGYIASNNQDNYGNRKSINIKARVPAQYFDSILNGISKNVEKFDSKNITISDVTEEFLDIVARLKNKKELEKKYLDILTKAKTVKEILQVERELGKLREDIESVEGRLKYLQNQVSFSTLQISFYKQELHTTSFGGRITEGFSNGFENLKSFFIGIINIWPFVIIGIIVVFLFRKWRKSRKTKK